MIIDGLIFRTNPWPHQLEALKFLMPRECGALYTDPGTGKSKVFVDLIVNRNFKRVIITGTKKPCETWVKQFKIHAQPGAFHVISLLDVPMPVKVQKLEKVLGGRKAEPSSRPVVIIVNYDVIWQQPLGDLLTEKFHPDCVVADESHRIKAASGKWTNYMTKLGRRSPNRFILSGTMIAEDPADAYGQFRFMDPTIFGTNVGQFKAKYYNYDTQASTRAGFPILNKHEPYKNMDDFYAKFWKETFRIPSSVKLPKRKNIIYEFEMGAKGCRAYQRISKDGAVDTKQGSLLIENALTKVIRHQQAVCGFIPLEDDNGVVRLYNTDKARMEALESLLGEFKPGEPVVVFAKFKKDIKNVRKVCDRLGISSSEVSGREDTESVWQAGKSDVIVVQYAAGSESIDLTRARYCIYYSLVHSYTQYYQSKKRIHRPHQNRMCVYYHLAALCNGKKTVDHSIIAALRRKQNLVTEIEQGRAELHVA